MKANYLHNALKEISQNYFFGGLFGLCLFWCLPSTWQNLVSIAGIAIFLSKIFASFIERYRTRAIISSERKAVFISGCDSGFGLGTAQALHDSGYEVFAGCLFPEGDGALKLRKSTSNRLHIVELDVTKEESVNNAAIYVKEHIKDNKLWAVVNNAGVFLVSELHWTDTDTLKRVIEVNAIGVIRVTKAFLSVLIESEGRIVTVASEAGRSTYPGLVAYCMSKHAAISFSDGLRLEMYQFGVKVVTIEPFLYKTSMANEENLKKSMTQTWNKAPEDVRKFYQPGYIEKRKKTIMKFKNTLINDNPNEVVVCIVEAVMAEHPRNTYCPLSMHLGVFVWLFQCLPKPLADFFIFNAIKI